MIKIIDGDFDFVREFKNFCKRDSFGTRIYSHFMCYGYEFDFAEFWVQVDETMNVTSVLCKIDGDVVVSLSENSDFDEITAFLNFQEKSSVTFDEKYADVIKTNLSISSVGDVLLYKSNDNKITSYELVSPEIKDYHNLLLTCRSSDFFVPNYMNFLADVSRRKQRQLCYIHGIVDEGKLVSCAMTVSYTDFSTIIGAVATHPEYRRHGYAGYIVKSLAERSQKRGSVYIYTTVKRNTDFYKTLGFVVTGRWIKYTMEDSFE